MDIKAIMSALAFLPVNDTIILQVPNRKDIPYVKRELFHILGEPRKIIDNSLFYEGKRIIICPVYDKKFYYGFSQSIMFYVGYEDGSEEEWLEVEHRPFRVVKLWKQMGLSFYTMHQALLNDGYTSVEAVDILKSAGVEC